MYWVVHNKYVLAVGIKNVVVRQFVHLLQYKYEREPYDQDVPKRNKMPNNARGASTEMNEWIAIQGQFI